VEQRGNSLGAAVHLSKLVPALLTFLVSRKADETTFWTFHRDRKPPLSIQAKFPHHLNKFMRVKKAFAGRIRALTNVMGLIECFPNRRKTFRPRQAIPVALLLFAFSFEVFGQSLPAIPSGLMDQSSTVAVRSDSQEKKGDVYLLRGHVVVTYKEMEVTADQASYNQSTNQVVATGHVAYNDPTAHLEADELHYNVATGQGWFLNGKGYVRPHMKHRVGVMQTESPFYVQAKIVERLNEITYRITDGRVTTCHCENTGWSISTSKASVKVGDRVIAHNNIFRFLRVPVLYAPVLVDSIAPRPRQSGFLLPTVGNSSQKGFTFGDGFYWAMNRSADLTLGAVNYSVRGLGGSAEFRARPTADSNFDVSAFGVNDQGPTGSPQLAEPGESIKATGQADHLWGGFRGVVNVDYASSLAFRETFANNFTQAVSSEARQMGFLTKNFNAYSLNFYISRYQNFLSTTGGAANSITIRHTPSFSLSGVDKQVGHTPLFFSFDTSAGAVERSQPGFATPNFADRFNLHPQLTLRMKPILHFHVTPSGGVWATRYGTSLRPDRSGIDRFMGDFSLDVRPPTLEKVFGRPIDGYLVKHVIEPDIQYRVVRATDPQDIMDVVRFDNLDTMAETNEIEYSLTNSILVRKDVGGGQPIPQAHELLSLRLSQIYYFDPTFGGALQPGSNIVFQPTSALTGFAFARGRNLSPLVSVLKLAPSSNYDTELRADFSPNGGGVLNAGITSNVHRGLVGLSLTDFFISRTAAQLTPVLPTTPLSEIPSYNLLRTVATYGNTNHNGFSGAFGVDYNFVEGVAHQLVGQAGYHFSCFAVNVEYRRFSLGPIRQENEFRVAISLANVGTFGTLRQNERLY
jgi:LPS-assembly protein